MRNFMHDETTERAITLTRKDWLMVCHLLRLVLHDLTEPELRAAYKATILDIVAQNK